MIGSDVVKQALAEIARPRDPFELIEGGHLYIRTKRVGGELVCLSPGTMKPAQVQLYRRVRELYYAGKPVRLRILKARQLGFSTLIQAIIFSVAAVLKNVTALVVADNADNADWLFGMSKLFQEEIEARKEYRLPPLKRSNRKVTEWEGLRSSIRVQTAGNPEFGRTQTRHLVHMSEYAYYEDVRRITEELLPSVPEEPGTMVFVETTANGINTFYHEWLAGDRGMGGYENTFFPWYLDPEYRRG